jgi:hypothetical protein
MFEKATRATIDSRVHQVEQWLDSIAVPDEFSGPDIADMLNDGKADIYFVHCDTLGHLMGIIVAMFQGKKLLVVGAAGSVEGHWEMLDKDYTALAKSKGCTSYEFRARRGFLRQFKLYGVTEKYTVMSKTF